MKKILNTAALFLGLCFTLSSCLKDSSLTLDTSQTNNVTEFANTGSIATSPSGTASPRYAIDLGSLKVGDTSSFKINVDYAGADMAPQDINVTIDIDASLLSVYNDEHSVDGANYIAPPASLFKTAFPITITIPKGQQFGQATINVQLSADYDFNASYALPLKITSTSTGEVSGNFGSALYSLNVRNIYDGRFTVTGTFIDHTNPDFHDSYPKTIDLKTDGATSNAYYDPNLNGGTYGYAFDAAGSGSYFGNFGPVFHFDADGNVTSVTNYSAYGPGTNSQARDAALNPSGVNKMIFNADGTPKEMNVSYYLMQGGSIRCEITEKFVYISPRP